MSRPATLAPRSSYLGALRNRKANTEHHGSVLTRTAHGAGIVPAYSEDSEILAVGFANAVGEGSILSRRKPDVDTGLDGKDGKEATSLKVTAGAIGGVGWCSTNNKFYVGVSELGESGDGACFVIDPERDIGKVITGFTGNEVGGRCFHHPGNGEIWMTYNTGGSGIARINPSDDSIVGYVSCPVPIDFCYGAGNLYFVTSTKLYKVNSGGTATELFDSTTIETSAGRTGFATIRSVEYVPSLGVIFNVQDPGAPFPYFVTWLLDTGTETATPTGFGSNSGFLYYSPEFDIVIAGTTPNSAWTSDFTSFVTLGTDSMQAPKGCFCTNVSKVALTVAVSGIGQTVKFYSAADLGA